MSKIHNIIRNILPFGIIERKNRNNFLDDYEKWKKTGQNVTFDEECHFKTIVSIDGFGSSGSSVVMDLLREYDNCTVWANKPSYTNSNENFLNLGEINIFRHMGGLFYIEQMFEPHALSNVYWCDMAIKGFMNTVYYSSIYKNIPSVRPLFYKFYEELIYQRLKNDKPIINLEHNLYTHIKDIFYIKPMSKDEYHSLCRKFLYTLFNRIFPDTKGHCLVLDHIIDDCGFDMDKFSPYLPGIKRIKIARDVRDVYVDAIRRNHRWLAHDTPEDFILWQKQVYRGYETIHHNYLLLHFENIVNDYESSIATIESFLGLSANNHKNKRLLFNPDISKKNIGQWKNITERYEDFEIIKKALPKFIFENK